MNSLTTGQMERLLQKPICNGPKAVRAIYDFSKNALKDLFAAQPLLKPIQAMGYKSLSLAGKSALIAAFIMASLAHLPAANAQMAPNFSAQPQLTQQQYTQQQYTQQQITLQAQQQQVQQQQAQQQQVQQQQSPRNGGIVDAGRVLGIVAQPTISQASPGYVTLHDTLRALFMNNKKIRGDRMTLAAARLAIVQAEAAYSPEVNFVATLGQNFINPEDDDVDNDIEGGTWNNYFSNNLEVTMRYMLYDFGARDFSMEVAKAEYRRQEASFRALVEEKMMEMISLYSEMRRALLQYKNLNDYYAQGLEMYKVVKDRTDNDLAPESDLEYVQLQLSEARQQLAQAEARILQSRRAFEQETGIWPQQLAPMPSVAVEQISQLTNSDEIIARAPSVAELHAETDRRQAVLRRIDAEDNPTISLEVTGFRRDNAGNSGNVDMGADGLVRFNMSLYDGGRGDATRQEALYNLRQVRYAADYTMERVKGDAMRRLIEVKQADAEIAMVRNMIRASEQIIRHNTRLFQAGLVSATFMIGSLRERAFYNIRLIDLENSKAVSTFSYALSMGILSDQLGISLDELMASINVEQEMRDENMLQMREAANITPMGGIY